MGLEPGSTIGRFVVEGRLGEGATAKVWRVRDTRRGTPYALKVLELRSKQVRARMLQEGYLQARLVHDNVVRMEDVLDVGGRPGLLLEYVEGPTLDAWLARHVPTTEEALTVFRGLCAGVGAAHHEGMIHRDLKPANVMMAVSGRRLVPRVTDFGLAKSLEDRGLAHTRIGRVLGTPAWMSPEQTEDASSVDRRTDLWALGCLLYRLVCGVQPFDGEDVTQVFHLVQGGGQVPSRQLRPDLPDRIHQAIDAMLVVDREERASDCASVLAFLDGLTHEIARDEPPGPARLPRTEHPTWLPLEGPGGVAALDAVADLAANLPKIGTSRKLVSVPPMTAPETLPPVLVPRPLGDAPARLALRAALALVASAVILLVALVASAVIASRPTPLEQFHRPEAHRLRGE